MSHLASQALPRTPRARPAQRCTLGLFARESPRTKPLPAASYNCAAREAWSRAGEVGGITLLRASKGHHRLSPLSFGRALVLLQEVRG